MNGFLFDENLPHRLTFTPSRSVVPWSVLGARPSDTQLWNYAREQSLAIVTKDADFSDRIMIAGEIKGVGGEIKGVGSQFFQKTDRLTARRPAPKAAGGALAAKSCPPALTGMECGRFACRM